MSPLEGVGTTPSDGVTTLLLIRHGETAWNREKRLQGQIDIPLSEVGERQAQRLAARVAAGSPMPIVDVVLSSDLSRAMQTAAPLAEALGLAVKVEPGLRERHYGVFQASTRDQIAVQWPQAHARWMGHDPDFAPEGGESIRQLSHRVVRVLAAIGRAYPGKTVACVTHGGVLDCAYRFAAQIPLEAPRHHTLLNASVNTIQWHDDEASQSADAPADHPGAQHAAHLAHRARDGFGSGTARVIAWGDVDHLSEAKDDSV